MVDVAGLKFTPSAGAFEGGSAPMAFSEGKLSETSVPKLGLNVLLDAILPVVQQIGSKRLKWTTDYLPLVLGIVEGCERQIPTAPEEVLFAVVKAAVDLPHSMGVVHDDGVTRIRMLGIHV